MATYQGQYKPTNPSKYKGNVNNIIYRSSWEKKFMNYLDRHPSVIYWSSEEMFVPYSFRGKRKRYFPDFIVEVITTSGQKQIQMIEIKPFKQTERPVATPKKKKKTLLNEYITYSVNQAKWKAAREFCQKNNMVFKIITEKELNTL